MARRALVATVARRGDSTATLQRLRDQLAEQIDAQMVTHAEGCACKCGRPAGDSRQIATLVKALSAILVLLDQRLPVVRSAEAAPVAPDPVPVDDELRRRRDARRSG
jgi:hypothetical protein